MLGLSIADLLGKAAALGNVGMYAAGTEVRVFSSLFFITLGLEMSDTKVYEP